MKEDLVEPFWIPVNVHSTKNPNLVEHVLGKVQIMVVVGCFAWVEEC